MEIVLIVLAFPFYPQAGHLYSPVLAGSSDIFVRMAGVCRHSAVGARIGVIPQTVIDVSV